MHSAIGMTARKGLVYGSYVARRMTSCQPMVACSTAYNQRLQADQVGERHRSSLVTLNREPGRGGKPGDLEVGKVVQLSDAVPGQV